MTTDFERRELERQLSTAHWRRNTALADASRLEDRVAELRRVASRIDWAAQPLSSVLTAVGALHTLDTWEGNAAVQSRRRLRESEDRTDTARSRIDGLVEDLRTEANAESTRLATAESVAAAELRRIWSIEIELERDDVLI